jgi:iron complex outermembrane receptor protein
MNRAFPLLVALLFVGPCTDAFAQLTPVPPDLTAISLEELMNIQITSASRKEQRASDVPAALYVITEDEIRRSGLRTIPELLRLAPGMDVARVNASTWSVTARGFGDVRANKLLVLIDGRTIYNRQFSGVFWDAADVLVEDIDRIEIIRGPGGAVWGANAMNGVVNIITKPPSATQGTTVSLGAGAFDRDQASVRFGGSAGDVAYRVFGQFSDHGASVRDSQASAGDNWHSATSGFRVDRNIGPNALSLESTVTGAHVNQPGDEQTVPVTISERDVNIIGHWFHTRPGGASLHVQSFADISHRQDSGLTADTMTLDGDVEYHTKLGRRHDVVSGGGYRFNRDSINGGFTFSVAPIRDDDVIINTFAQDEIMIIDRVRLTLGAKLEHETHAGWGIQPTAGVMWDFLPRQHLWASMSRALRTPSRTDYGILVHFAGFTGDDGVPVGIGFIGNPAYHTEELVNREVGYRHEFGSSAAVDVSAFLGRYRYLETQEPIAPFFEAGTNPPRLFVGAQLGNLLDATTKGAEIAGHWIPVPGWRLDGSYTAFHLAPRLNPASGDTAQLGADGNVPRHQWQLRSAVMPAPRLDVRASVFYVGAIGQIGIPAYTRADATVEWKLAPHVAASVNGQNLFDRSHVEFSNVAGIVGTRVPRSADLRLRWNF